VLCADVDVVVLRPPPLVSSSDLPIHIAQMHNMHIIIVAVTKNVITAVIIIAISSDISLNFQNFSHSF
jgi:hypothetical protein